LENLTGDAARILYKHVSEQEGLIQSAREEPSANLGAATTPNETASAEPLDLLSDQVGIQKKGWYYVEDSKGRGFFIALINAKGSGSTRTFDAGTGRFLGKRYNKKATYQDHFVPQLKNPRELSVDEQPNLERDCRQQLPQSILSQLKKQL